jgi:2-methylcitrate dehydratase
MSTINRGVRTASRKLRLPALQARALRAPLTSATRASFGASRTSFFRQFSAMAPLQSGAPPPPQAREYDPEIKDIASYVHHTPITSDLAVSFTVSLNYVGYFR